MRSVVCGFLLLTLSVSAKAGTVSTPGAIASLMQLPGTQFQYEPVADLSVLIKGRQTQYLLSVLPGLEPELLLRHILTELNAQQYLPAMETATIAGYPAATVHARLQNSNWWCVVQLPELNLFVRVEDIDDAVTKQADVAALVKSVRFAPATQPSLVSGYYTMSSSYNGSPDSSFGAYSESSITLQPDGSFNTSSHVGVTGADVSGYSEGSGPGGWWQVRGNRILAYEPGTFYNYRFEAFSNGLELYNESNEKLLWVRN